MATAQIAGNIESPVNNIRALALAALPFVLLTALAVGLYLPSLEGDFVYDSQLQILTDSFIHQPAHWRDVLTLRVMGMDVLDFNRPVQLASLMADAAIWGRDPLGYRLTSLLLHALNGCLLFALLSKLSGLSAAGQRQERWGICLAMALSALFLVHPIAVEAVCEPSNREDLLATAFTLGALLCALRITRTGHGGIAIAGTLALTFLAVASKETGVAAPAVVTALVLFLPGKSSRCQRVVLAVAPWLLAAAFLTLRFVLEPSTSAIFVSKPEYPGGSLASAMALQPRIFALYLANILQPTSLCADYGLYSVRDLPLSLGLWLMGLAAVGLAVGGWKDRRIALAATGILAALLPVSNLVPIYRAAADRYLYLPLAFAAIIPFCLLDIRAIRRHGFPQVVILAIAAAGILHLAGINEKMQAIWQDAGSLWAACAERNPLSFSGQVGTADFLLGNRRWEEARTRYLHCLEMQGGRGRADVWAGLAICDDALGDRSGAIAAAREAVRIDHTYATEETMLRGLSVDRDFAGKFSALLKKYPAAPKEVASP